MTKSAILSLAPQVPCHQGDTWSPTKSSENLDVSKALGKSTMCWQLQSELENWLFSCHFWVSLKDTEAETMGSNLEPWPHATPPKINILEPQSRQVSLPQRIDLLTVCNRRPSKIAAEKPFANQVAYWSAAPLKGSMHELLHMTCHSLECTSLPAASRNTRARRTRLLSPNFPLAAGFQEFWT